MKEHRYYNSHITIKHEILFISENIQQKKLTNVRDANTPGH